MRREASCLEGLRSGRDGKAKGLLGDQGRKHVDGVREHIEGKHLGAVRGDTDPDDLLSYVWEENMLKWKIDIWQALEAEGINMYQLKKRGGIGQQTAEYLKAGQTNVSLKTVDALCRMLKLQPGDLLEYEE